MAKKSKTDKKELNFKRNFKIYLDFLKKYKWMFILLLFVIFIHEVKQIIDKFIIKLAIDNATKYVAGAIEKSVLVDILMALAIAFIILTIISVITSWFKFHFLNRLDANMIFDLKKKYFNHIVHLDQEFHTTHKTGSLISRLSRGSGAIESMNDVIAFNFAPVFLQLIILTVTLIYLDITSAIIISITVVIFLTFSLTKQKKVDIMNKEKNAASDIERGNMADIFTNIESIKYFGKEIRIKNRYKNLSAETKKRSLKAWELWKGISAWQSIILSSGILALFFFSFRGFIAGNLTLGTLTFVYTTFLGIIGQLFGFIHGIRGFSRGMTDMQDLFDYGEVEKTVKDKKNAPKLSINKGEVEFRNITFKYLDGKKVFKNFNLKIPKNKIVALVGQSGCGKSTLINLLYRLYDVQEGKILIDRKDIKNYQQESLREEMAIVPQEAILFDDTIFNNLKFANPKATNQEIWQAMKFAQLDKFVKELPKKEKTIVGERGVKLSGGQKQRVSIARAILADKKILVLDEATSALDSETEWEIQKDLKKLMKGRTSIIIAHRLSTIMHADIIVVMKEGKILQKGTHRELITEGGEYAKLWEFQKGGFIVE